MSVEEHLLKDENILAECAEKEFRFYATDRRLLKFKKGGFFSREVLHDISYGEITSVSLEIIRGLPGAVISGIGMLLIWFVFSELYVPLLTDRYIYRTLLLLVAMLGVVTIIAGILYKTSWFQFKGHGLLSRKEEAEIWRLKEVDRADTRRFIRVVREELLKREKV